MIYKTVFIFLVLSLFFYEKSEAIKRADLCGRKLTPVFTAFKGNGDLNLNVIPSYARYLINNNLTTIWVNAISSEPFSLNLAEQESNAAAWIRICKSNPIKCVIGVNFLTIRDSCKLARYADSQNVAAIVHSPSTNAGPTNAAQLASDFSYVARCAPSTPVFLVYNPNFACGRTINYGEAVRILARTVPNFAGLIGPLETVLRARSYNGNSTCDNNVQYVVFYYYSVSASNLLNFDAHSTPFANIFPDVVNQIDNADCRSESLEAQDRLDELASPLCYLRTDCRIICPINILKASFIIKTGIQIGGPRSPPLCPISRNDFQEVTAFLRSKGQPIRGCKPKYESDDSDECEESKEFKGNDYPRLYT